MKNTKRQNNNTKQLKRDYDTVADFLMNGEENEVREFAQHMNWNKFVADCGQWMRDEFKEKFKSFLPQV